MLAVRLSEDMSNRLSALSLMTNRPKSFYVKEALSTYLDEHEETYKAIAEYEDQKRRGGLKLTSLEEVKRKYDLS